MTAEQAIKTLEGIVTHYKKAMPESIKNIEEAIGALKNYIMFAEGRMASTKLDIIANKIQAQDPVIAMALDKISDILDKKASPSPLLIFHAFKDIWEENEKNKEKFIKAIQNEIKELGTIVGDEEIRKALERATNGAITLEMIKTSGFLTGE